jgi:hypothetical protein
VIRGHVKVEAPSTEGVVVEFLELPRPERDEPLLDVGVDGVVGVDTATSSSPFDTEPSEPVVLVVGAVVGEETESSPPFETEPSEDPVPVDVEGVETTSSPPFVCAFTVAVATNNIATTANTANINRFFINNDNY